MTRLLKTIKQLLTSEIHHGVIYIGTLVRRTCSCELRIMLQVVSSYREGVEKGREIFPPPERWGDRFRLLVLRPKSACLPGCAGPPGAFVEKQPAYTFCSDERSGGWGRAGCSSSRWWDAPAPGPRLLGRRRGWNVAGRGSFLQGHGGAQRDVMLCASADGNRCCFVGWSGISPSIKKCNLIISSYINNK